VQQHLQDTQIFWQFMISSADFVTSDACYKQLTCFCTSATLSLCFAGAFSLVQYTQQYLALRYSSKAALKGSKKNKQKNHLWCVMPHSSRAPPLSTCPAMLLLTGSKSDQQSWHISTRLPTVWFAPRCQIVACCSTHEACVGCNQCHCCLL
jgi:hypothetical protein